MSSEDKQGKDSAALVRDLRHGSWTAQIEEMLHRAADHIEKLEGELAHLKGLHNLGWAQMDCPACGTACAVAAAPVSASAERDPWKEAVIDGLICAHIYRKEHDADPRKALNELLAWEQSVALDPKVSAAAEALVEQGRQSALSSSTDAQDAARYRWLRTGGNQKCRVLQQGRYADFLVTGEGLDKMVDAALSATMQSKEE